MRRLSSQVQNSQNFTAEIATSFSIHMLEKSTTTLSAHGSANKALREVPMIHMQKMVLLCFDFRFLYLISHGLATSRQPKIKSLSRGCSISLHQGAADSLFRCFYFFEFEVTAALLFKEKKTSFQVSSKLQQLVWETLFSSGCLNSKLWTLLQDFIDLQSKTPTTPEESVAASIGGRHAGGAVVVCRSEVVRERG